MSDQPIPALFRRYVCDVIDVLHFLAMEEQDVRNRIRACEVILRYISDAAQFVDTVDRIERIEQELGISVDEEVDEDDGDDEAD